MPTVLPAFNRRQVIAIAVAAAPWMLVIGYVGFLYYQTFTSNFVGPHRWDDFKYISRALSGDFDFHLRFRYAHIWGLRAAFELIADRRVAAAAYAATMNGGLVLLAYAFGARAAGIVCGLLAALLIPTFLPLAQFWSTPLCDPPCTLYAGLAVLCALKYNDSGKGWLWAMLSGLLVFASIKSKETGIVVAPVVAWLLTERSPHRLRTLLHCGAGLLAGQVLLCAVDGWISGDPFQSLRLAVYQKYMNAVSSLPTRKSAGRRVLLRAEWMEMLLRPGVREFALAGVAGLALGFRRGRVQRALGLWMAFSLIFGAWVCFRYAGIDAHIRYLAPFSLSLCVGAAYALVHIYRMVSPAGASFGDDAGPVARANDGLRPLPAWLPTILGLAVTLLGVVGLYYGYRAYAGGGNAFTVRRGAAFLFPLVLPLGLCAAALLPWRRARAVPLTLCLAALLLVGQASARGYIRNEYKEIRGWVSLGRKASQMPRAKVALHYAYRPSIKPQLLHWRIAALSNVPFDEIKVRQISKIAQLRTDELLVVDHRRKLAKVKKSSIPPKPWKRFARVALNHREAHAYYYAGEQQTARSKPHGPL